jgi:hypothetical protein
LSRVHVADEADRLALHVLVAADAELGQHGAAAGVEDGGAAVGDKSEVAEGAWELLGVWGCVLGWRR